MSPRFARFVRPRFLTETASDSRKQEHLTAQTGFETGTCWLHVLTRHRQH